VRRTTARAPPLHAQRNALEIEPGNATLKTLPTNAEQVLPTPSWDAGSTGGVREPTTPESPKESINFVFSGASGRQAWRLTDLHLYRMIPVVVHQGDDVVGDRLTVEG
jgi:hypothetical protein